MKFPHIAIFIKDKLLMKYIYIHGFNSGGASASGKRLSRMLNRQVFCPEYDYSRTFPECMDSLSAQISGWSDDDLFIMGKSLGGFYALQFRLPHIQAVAAWNPVVFPALQLKQFLGENRRFTDGASWIFTPEAAQSYAVAADPRVWRNFYWRGQARRGDNEPRRHIFLGDHDEILDSEVARAFWQGHATVTMIPSGHDVENYEHARDFLGAGIDKSFT